jgi:hypothetical protein
MSETPYPTFVDHPLWSQFLRWCTIRPKRWERPSSSLLIVPSDKNVRLESLNDYEYTPLPDPQSYIRLATVLPGKFDDNITINIRHHALRHGPRERYKRLELVETRKHLPSGWEAFQTVS